MDGFEKRTKHSVHLRYRETKWTTTPQIVLYCPISKKNIVDKTTTIHPSIRLFSPQSLMMIQVIRKAFHINSSACGHTHQNKKEWIFISFRFDCLSCLPVLYALPCLPDLAMQAAGCSDIYNRILGTKQRTRRRIINRNEIYGPGVILWDSNNMSPCLQTQHEAL